MKKIVLVLAVMFLFLLVVGVTAQDVQNVQKQDYTELIIGVWEWKGTVNGQSVKVVQEFFPDRTMDVRIYAGSTIYPNIKLIYQIEKDMLLLFLSEDSNVKWGLSRIVGVGEASITFIEITDFTGEKKGKTAGPVTYNRLSL